jgi:hypothetical protein
MVNDGLISALSRMENAASLPHGGPSGGARAMSALGYSKTSVCGGQMSEVGSEED